MALFLAAFFSSRTVLSMVGLLRADSGTSWLLKLCKLGRLRLIDSLPALIGLTLCRFGLEPYLEAGVICCSGVGGS